MAQRTNIFTLFPAKKLRRSSPYNKAFDSTQDIVEETECWFDSEKSPNSAIDYARFLAPQRIRQAERKD
jgi:hypothetical protein